MALPYLDGDTLRATLRIGPLVEALRAGHRGPVPMMERVLMTSPAGDSMLVWHAWQPGDVIALKIATVFLGNPSLRPPRPSVQSLLPVFDGATGSPVAVVDGTELTYWKTAASSGLSASYLARGDVRTLVLVGAGGLAPYLVMAHRAVRPSIERVLVWNRTRSRASAVAAHPFVGDGVEAVDDLEAAVRSADVVCCATASTSPLVRGAWLRPGVHLDLVGGYTPAMREADDDAVMRARLFVDAAMFTIDHCGDISQPIASGLRARADVEADLFGLCRGEHPGRTSADDITLSKSGGGAHLDLFAVQHALAVCA